MTEEVRRLYRSREQRMIAGVCGGLAEYTNLDPTIVRLLFVAVSLLGAAPGMLLAYLAMMVIVPEEMGTLGFRTLRFEGQVSDLPLFYLGFIQVN